MAIPGLVAASNLADTENKEAVWDNLGNGIDAAIPTTNLLLRSEEFGASSSWTVVQLTVTSNEIEAPNGSLTADKLVETVSTSIHFIFQPFTFAPNKAYAFSMFVKRGERFRGIMSLDTGLINFGRIISVSFDLSAKTFNASAGAIVSVTEFPNSWFRLSLAATSAAGGPGTGVGIRTSPDDGSSSYAGDGVSGFYVWGAQLEEAEEAGPYVPTTTAPVSASPTASIAIKGDDILELIGARLTATSDFVRIKELTTPAQPRLTTAAASTASGAALRDNALLKASPSSEGDYFLSRGTLDGQSLRINGLNIASLSGSPFSGDTASCPLLISSFAAPTNLRINNAMASGTLAFPERAIPIETDQFIFYAKAGQS